MTGQTQIVAQWSDAADYDELIAIEDQLIEHAANSYDVDGHDVGSGTFNVFMFAADNDVDAAVGRIIQMCKDGVVPPEMKLGVAVYLDPERTEWVFRPAYPSDLTLFELM